MFEIIKERPLFKEGETIVRNKRGNFFSFQADDGDGSEVLISVLANPQHAVISTLINRNSNGCNELFALILYMEGEGYELVSHTTVQQSTPYPADGRNWRLQYILATFRRAK
jgi:hypothetical protein